MTTPPPPIGNEEHLLTTYLARHPQESERTQSLAAFLTRHPTRDARTSRHNFDGHLTASAFILNQERTHLLLIHHKSLNRLLQPGGHTEPHDPSLYHAALREIEEELAIPAHHLALDPRNAPHLPIDIDSHPIPPNPQKAEPAHTHHDIRFLFLHTPPEGAALQANLTETNGHAWTPLTEITHPDFALLLQKLRA